MKIKPLISFALCSLLSTTAVFAQEAESALAKVHYIFKHVNDTTQPDKYLRDEVATYLGKTSSYYTSYSSARMEEDVQKQLNDPAFDGNLVLTKNTSGIRQFYLYNYGANTLKEVSTVGTDHFILDADYPALDWTISEETKTIGGYSCQKAEVSFKGRDYTAWFTTELPFSAGPWKLQGLPGLILEAYDSKKEVQFEYSGFDKMDAGKFTIAAPQKAIASTQKEVAKLAEAFQANPQAYMQAKQLSIGTTSTPVKTNGGGTASITVTSSGGSSGSSNNAFDASRIKSMNIKTAEGYAPSRVTNNPIELTP